MLSLTLLLPLATLSSASLLPLTGQAISTGDPIPPIAVSPKLGRPVKFITPLVHHHKQTKKTVTSHQNVPALRPVKRTRLTQDVHHQFTKKEYTVVNPVPEIHNVPVPYHVPVYHHETEVKAPVNLIRQHHHTRRVHHTPLVKTADIVQVQQPNLVVQPVAHNLVAQRHNFVAHQPLVAHQAVAHQPLVAHQAAVQVAPTYQVAPKAVIAA